MPESKSLTLNKPPIDVYIHYPSIDPEAACAVLLDLCPEDVFGFDIFGQFVDGSVNLQASKEFKAKRGEDLLSILATKVGEAITWAELFAIVEKIEWVEVSQRLKAAWEAQQNGGKQIVISQTVEQARNTILNEIIEVFLKKDPNIAKMPANKFADQLLAEPDFDLICQKLEPYWGAVNKRTIQDCFRANDSVQKGAGRRPEISK